MIVEGIYVEEITLDSVMQDLCSGEMSADEAEFWFSNLGFNVVEELEVRANNWEDVCLN